MRSSVQERVLEQAIRRKPAQVLAVCSGKGGVGKTNVAVNLAVALAGRARRVCLLDADVSLANVDVLLGLQPRFNLSHVVRGEADLASTIVSGPNDLQIIPASSGNFSMTDLPAAAQMAIVREFSNLEDQPDTLVVDTAAGITPAVARFVQAARHALVVVCDEPAALTDAYALIKVFSRNYGISHFQVVTNQSTSATHGRLLFDKLDRVAGAYLDVVLNHLGDVPNDRHLVRAVREQRAVVQAYPESASAAAFEKLARHAANLPTGTRSDGGIEFFFERLVSADNSPRGLVA